MDWLSKFASQDGGYHILVLLLALGGGAIAIWRAYVLDQQRKISDKQRQNDEQKLHNDEQRLHTDSYIRAVEQLGADKKEVRLGGIYGLGRIAKEDETHRRQIINLLCAYIVENASGSKTEEQKPPPAHEEPKSPPADILAILDIINENRRGEWRRFRPNLKYVDFENMDFFRFSFERFDFTSAKFKKASFNFTYLEEAYLNLADLEEATLHHADLEGARLNLANLAGARMAKTKKLTQKQIDSAFGDSATELPEDLKAPPHWPKVRLASKAKGEWQKWIKDQKNYKYKPPQRGK